MENIVANQPLFENLFFLKPISITLPFPDSLETMKHKSKVSPELDMTVGDPEVGS